MSMTPRELAETFLRLSSNVPARPWSFEREDGLSTGYRSVVYGRVSQTVARSAWCGLRADAEAIGDFIAFARNHGPEIVSWAFQLCQKLDEMSIGLDAVEAHLQNAMRKLRAAQSQAEQLAENNKHQQTEIERLRNENSRLHSDCSVWRSDVSDHLQEIERLRVENAELKGKLSVDWEKWNKACADDEITLLREALEWIAEMPNRIGVDADCECASAKDCWECASAALTGKGGDEK